MLTIGAPPTCAAQKETTNKLANTQRETDRHPLKSKHAPLPFRFILPCFHSLVLLPTLRSTSPIPLFSPAHRLSAPVRRAKPKYGPSATPLWLAPVRPLHSDSLIIRMRDGVAPPLALNRKILQLPPVTTVASGRLRSARRALRAGAALGTDEPTLLEFFEPQ
jgi:hypothetical protein